MSVLFSRVCTQTVDQENILENKRYETKIRINRP